MKTEQLILRDTSFVDLMTRRIFNVLIVANPYDAFMLEDDGRIDEKIFDEYAKLGLRYPPRFFQAASEDEAREIMGQMKFELVICMPGAEVRKDTNEASDVFDIARTIKSFSPEIPIVVLTPFSHGITKRMQNEDLSIFEYVFCWLGNTDLLLSIIKLMEDKMNLQHDIETAGVQMIMLVEDSIRFYSSILPNLYKFVLQQSLSFATEALNSQLETLRMRGRPKIVLARSYEEAWRLYSQFKDNTLGVISDCKFPMSEYKKELRDKKLSLSQQKDEQAGYKLLSAIRAADEYVPLIMESTDPANAVLAERCHAKFIDKNSKKLAVDLQKLVSKYFGFGDFIFRNDKKEIVAVIKNLKDLQDNIFTIPREALLYQVSRNNVSRWLCSRALFPISEFLKKITWHSLQDVDRHRQIIYDAIVSYRRMKNRGVVATFRRDRFDRFSNFARIGDGSLGGKGRGLAFLDHIITRHTDLNDFENAEVTIPKTIVLCTDIFDEFMEKNELYQVALSDASNDEILQHFLDARLPEQLYEDLSVFADVVNGPMAIRSSSLLEDAHYQPFAGVYSTYMVPRVQDRKAQLDLLCNAIKAVYASVYYCDSKAYMVATSNVIDQEKMAVILQEVVGTQYDNYFYPNISGVARSINYYPIGDEKAEEGTVDLALGLGKYIVDGGLSLRVCPHHPHQVLQTSEMEIALKETQTYFLALDTRNINCNFKVDDGYNLLKVMVRDAEKDGSLQWICSTYDPYDQCIYDGFYEGRNRKLITFSGVLQHGVFPLPAILQLILRYGQEEMRRPVEIEFAVKLNADKTGQFNLLQIRPMVDNTMVLEQDITQIPDEECLLRSHNAIGMGISNDIVDVVYVKTDNFNAQNNPRIAEQVTRINAGFLDKGSYILVGPGRWGSSDPWLGIPVKWPNISAARLIVEAGLKDYRVDPSQGTHFFQNLTSFGVGYFIVNDYLGDGVYRTDYLDSLPAVQETEFVRHVRLPKPATIMIDGMKKEGVVTL
ncbi:MAG: phosphoenolpyruvate synthase [Prevotellaceae bacterium]|nr:phosphoenolpyruvate synthase [Candidatus Colivivens caballi]